MKIGIDIGNVIIDGNGEDTIFSEDYLGTPAVVGAIEAITELSRANHEIHLVSKCGEEVELRSVEWLNYYKFYYLVETHRMHFVRKRRLKAPMAEALELEVFIDDREDIIKSMQGVVKHPILFISWEQTMEELTNIL